jgi:hypothetical protein
MWKRLTFRPDMRSRISVAAYTAAPPPLERAKLNGEHMQNGKMQIGRTLASAVIFACAGALSMPSLAADAAPAAGVVKVASGQVTAERDGVRRDLRTGDAIYAGERIRTAENARAAITMRDDTRMSLGSKTIVDVKAFNYDTTKQEGNMLISVFRGVTAFVSGLLGKSGADRMKVAAPTATIGVRGTEFIVEVSRLEGAGNE